MVRVLKDSLRIRYLPTGKGQRMFFTLSALFFRASTAFVDTNAKTTRLLFYFIFNFLCIS